MKKTEITVSCNVSDDLKKELSDRLGVRAVDRHTKYLGLPTLIGRGKRQTFSGIVDRVVQKMKDWKERSLSQAGKEVLIKTVIQAIPSYLMNCFLFPIRTCQEIEKATTLFLWGSTIDDKKCHWAAWDILTTPKAAGGIGFRELHYIFSILRCLLNNFGILWNTYRLLKAKYFPRTEILSAGPGYRPSYLWRSLLSAKELIKEGMAWRIGNGKRMSIWIGVSEPRCPIQDENDTTSENRRWRRELIIG